MARPRIIDSNSAKFSIVVTGDNKKTLDELTENYNYKYGPMINKIIGTFCRMPKKIRKVIEKACLAEYNRLTEELAHIEEKFHRKPLEQELEFYLEILRLINGGIYKITDETEEPTMKKIKLADGYLIIPSDWIVVNPEQAENCHYAAVLECMHSDQYGVPHFIYLNNYKYGNEFTDSMKEDFFSLCCKEWPRFKEIEEINEKNQLIPDPNNKGEYLNLEEHLAAPVIGLFSIEEKGENPIERMPYGAMIIRNENEE